MTPKPTTTSPPFLRGLTANLAAGCAVAATLLAALPAARGETITIYPGPQKIEIGSTRQISAYVPLSPNSVVWTVNDLPGGNTTFGTISTSGLYKAPAVAPMANSITIKAVSTAYPAAQGSATLTITRKYPWVWSTSPSTAQAGPFEISLNGSNFAPDSQVLADGQPVQTQYFSPTKLVAKGMAQTPGTVKISVRQPAPGEVVGNSVNLQITAPTIVVGLSPGSATLQLGSGQSFAASVSGSANTAVTWSVNGIQGGSSALGTISAAGYYTAPLSMPSPSAVTIRASSAALPSAYAQAVVTLLPLPPVTVEVSPASCQNYLGETRSFGASVTGTANTGVTWSVNGLAGGSGTVGTITASGLYTAPSLMPSPSNVVIRATSVANPLAYGEASLTLLPPPSGPATSLHAARFLEQSSFGPTPASLAAAQQAGIEAHLAQQFAMPASPIPTPANNSNASLRQWMLHNYTAAPDQLRQRVAYALSQIIVCSAGKLNYADELLPWLRALSKHAFGNYKDLLREVTQSPSMGKYLDLANSLKPGMAGGANENFARELAQLFTIGLWQLNMDGSLATNGLGQPIPTYDQADITQLALALTGWTYATAPGATPQNTNWEYFGAPMETRQQNHATNAKTALGFQIPAGQTVAQDLESVLEGLMSHSNTAPFVSIRLIRSLVTSNPSKAYVERVANVFVNNGAGVRGDLKAVVTAILLDEEARNDVAAADQGRLKEPVLQICGLLRALNGQFNPGQQLTYVFDSMAQSILNPPSVFSWFSPLYRVPNSTLFGPEFQIYTPTEATLRGNMIQYLLSSGGGDFAIDLSPFQPHGSDMPGLVEKANQILLHGRMPAAMKQILANAAAPGYDAATRIQTVLYLTALSGQHAVQH